jgi:hypothetical protein
VVTGLFTARYLTLAYIAVLVWWAITTAAATIMARHLDPPPLHPE